MKYYPKECILTLDELKVLCDEWKQILGLQNWEIVLLLVGHLSINGLQGNCTYTITSRQAIIKLLNPEHYDNDDFPYDMEETLVHEMLHCYFSMLDIHLENSLADHIHEQNIDLLANALVGLKRGQNER